MGKGRLHLSMVDDGMYSGYFTRADGDLEDNARVRIDKINLPELCMLIQAKEWNRSEEKEPVEVPETMGDSPEVEKFNVGAVPAAFSENAEMKPEAPESSEALRILELVAKLTGR